MNELLELYERKACLAIEIGHNSIADWCITIYDRKGTTFRDAKVAVQVQECNYELAAAKAYVGLCEYLSETRGGY